MISSRDTEYPGRDTGVIGINPGKERVRAILKGLAGTRCLTVAKPAGLSPRPAPLPSRELQAALGTAGNQSGIGLARQAKRTFLRWQYNWCYHLLKGQSPHVVACWNGLKGHRFLALMAARRCGHATLYLEEAPLPDRLTVDFSGINHGGSLPDRSDFYRHWLAENPGIDPGAWRSIRSDLSARKVTHRHDVGQNPADTDLSRQNYIFCPLQVPGDSQITVYGDWVASVDDMISHLEKAAAALPEGWSLRVKEHPNTRVSFARRLSGLAKQRIVLDNFTDTMEQIAASRAVLTINSSVGFESFFFDKPVLVLGHAFYGFDQLATKVQSSSHLAHLLADPEKLSFNPSDRNAFMSYVVERHFPSETDILAGRITLDDIVVRDHARDDLMRSLAPHSSPGR